MGLERVIVRARVSDHHMLEFLPAHYVFTEQLAVFLYSSIEVFCVLQSSIHEVWTRKYASTLKTDVRYIPTDCHGTFPYPSNTTTLSRPGEEYLRFRRGIMKERGIGLTKTYNKYHDRENSDIGIRKLRELHIASDLAVAAAYGWTDLDLGHGFHETKQGVRFTISEPARREVLQRLLKLNHERYAEEVKQGLHGKKGAAKKAAPRRKSASKPAKQEVSLFDGEDN